MEQDPGDNCPFFGKPHDPNYPNDSAKECSGCPREDDCFAIQYLIYLRFPEPLEPLIAPLLDAHDKCEFPDRTKEQAKFIKKTVNKWIKEDRARHQALAKERKNQIVSTGERKWPWKEHKKKPRIMKVLRRTHFHDIMNFTKKYFATIEKSDKLAEELRQARKKKDHKLGCGYYCHYDEKKSQLLKHPLIYFRPDYPLAELRLEITSPDNGDVIKIGMGRESLRKTLRQAARACIFPSFGKVKRDEQAIYAYGYETGSEWHRNRQTFVKATDPYWDGVLEKFLCGENPKLAAPIKVILL